MSTLVSIAGPDVDETARRPRRPYSPPELTEFGNVNVLTRGTSKGMDFDGSRTKLP